MPQRVARIIALGLAYIISGPALANRYTPNGMYEVEQLRLENGMQVLLKERGDALNVSLRLVVGLGTLDFECGRRETAHFLEHLVFEGTSTKDGHDLDGLIESHGGYWNAVTQLDSTAYELDIYSPHADLGVETLHEMVTDSVLAPEDVERVRRIIHRESDVDGSAFGRWLYRYGIGKTALDKAYEHLGLGCFELERADQIGVDELRDTYERYYVAPNMTLVIVGNFDRENLLNSIHSTFGTMRPRSAPQRGPLPRATITGPVLLSNTLSPIVGRGAAASIVFPVDGYVADEYPVLLLMENYLGKALYERLRRTDAISYSPAVSYELYGAELGTFYVTADVQVSDIQIAVNGMWGELERLSRGEIEPSEIEKVKHNVLLDWARGYESNADFADYYASSLSELTEHGEFINQEDLLEAVTPAQVQAVATQYLTRDKALVLHSAPTLTYADLGMGVFTLVLGFGSIGLFLTRRKQTSIARRNRPAA